MTVGERIKQKRIELGISQDELAQKMGYASKSAVSRTENSGDNIGRKRVIAYAEALGCEPSDLMGWKSEELDESYSIKSENDFLIEIEKMDSVQRKELLMKLLQYEAELLKEGE